MRSRGATGLRFETDAGSFVIDFRGVDAPINQANLVALADKGYFDDLSVHRVVPGFVAQWGDPRGDGYGGPGYLVPCEWSNLRYDRGTVGMALAGKDTGGSQLFVTLGDAPHLDARPSDAIALALRAGCRIRVAEDVLERGKAQD